MCIDLIFRDDDVLYVSEGDSFIGEILILFMSLLYHCIFKM